MSSSYWKHKSKSKQFSQSKNNSVPQQPPKKSIHKWTYGKGSTCDHIKIASWNVNGIRSVYNRRFLEPYLQKNDIDILCVNQTKIDQIAYDKAPITLHGYSGYWNFCKCSAGYSGVAIFSRFLPISMQEDLPQPKHCHQGRTIVLEFEKFYLVAVYVPNSGSKLERLPYRVNQFDIDFQRHIQKLRDKKHVIVAGDLNVVRDEIDIYKSQNKVQMSKQMPACTPQQRKNLQNLINLGYIDSFRELYPEKVQYTWWNMKIQARKRNIGWRIDYILINEEMRPALIDANVQDQVMGSDHCPVQIMLDISQIKQQKRMTRSLQQATTQKKSEQMIEGQYFNIDNCDSYSVDFEGDNEQASEQILRIMYSQQLNQQQKESDQKIVFVQQKSPSAEDTKKQQQKVDQKQTQHNKQVLYDINMLKQVQYLPHIQQHKQNNAHAFQRQHLQCSQLPCQKLEIEDVPRQIKLPCQQLSKNQIDNREQVERRKKSAEKQRRYQQLQAAQQAKMVSTTKKQPIKFQTIAQQQPRKPK